MSSASASALRISAEVDEEDISLVKPDQEVLIRADAFPGKVFHGKVQSITPKGDPVARSYRVRIGFTEDTPFQIGMTAETNIIVRKAEDALLLPNGAISQNDKIWLLKGDGLAEQPVRVGVRGDEKSEILDGVTMEDEVVLKYKPGMGAGRKVRAKLVPQAH
jgi:multidrug efflux pump subunit AcrA (membrane-fusion protein)